MATHSHDDIHQLVRETIDIAELAQHVRAPEDGAVVTFDGFVRNQSHNRSTLYLDYEAYESMALAKMREIGAQLHFASGRASAAPRHGRVQPGQARPSSLGAEAKGQLKRQFGFHLDAQRGCFQYLSGRRPREH